MKKKNEKMRSTLFCCWVGDEKKDFLIFFENLCTRVSHQPLEEHHRHY